jgi:hypothetical protein
MKNVRANTAIVQEHFERAPPATDEHGSSSQVVKAPNQRDSSAQPTMAIETAQRHDVPDVPREERK